MQTRRPDRFAIIVLEGVTAALGIALIVAAASATQSWLDRHFLPSFFIPRQWYVLIETSARAAVAAAGAALALGRSRLAQLVMRAPAMTVSVVSAAVLAVACGELALRWIHLRPTEWLVREEEP